MKCALLMISMCGILCIVAPGMVSARTWHVPSEAATIQAGIDTATAGDIVEIACGTYYENDVVMKSGITLRSENGDPTCVIIDGQNVGRVFYCRNLSSDTRLEGLTITGGALWGEYLPGCCGAGMICLAADPVISDCHFIDNFSHTGGGGLYCEASNPLLERCLFSGNHVEISGGAIEITNASPHFFECIITGNSSDFIGGGISINPICSPEFTSCTIVSNSAQIGGGIICDGYSSPTLTKCLIAFNDGEGFYHSSSNAYFYCCDIYGNSGGDWIGGIGGMVAINGNFSADPCFCDIEGGNFHLCSDSWCMPGNHPWGCSELVGALGQGCDACSCSGPIPNVHHSWGYTKSLYR